MDGGDNSCIWLVLQGIYWHWNSKRQSGRLGVIWEVALKVFRHSFSVYCTNGGSMDEGRKAFYLEEHSMRQRELSYGYNGHRHEINMFQSLDSKIKFQRSICLLALMTLTRPQPQNLPSSLPHHITTFQTHLAGLKLTHLQTTERWLHPKQSSISRPSPQLSLRFSKQSSNPRSRKRRA